MGLSRALGAAVLLTAGAAAGCTVHGPGEAQRQVAPAYEQQCVRLLRDLRLFCQESARNPHAPTSADCISRRLQFEQACH